MAPNGVPHRANPCQRPSDPNFYAANGGVGRSGNNNNNNNKRRLAAIAFRSILKALSTLLFRARIKRWSAASVVMPANTTGSAADASSAAALARLAFASH